MTLGFKDFVAGDVLTAAQVDGYLMRQTVMVFATDAARDSALSGNLEEGMHCFTEDNNRLYYYTGAAWMILSEPVQTWSAVTVTQGSPIAGTIARGWYRRSNGFWQGNLEWEASAGGTPTEVITVTTPLTLANSADIGGTYTHFRVGSGVFFSDGAYRNNTTTFRLVASGGTALLGASYTIASGDIFKFTLTGTY
jgi:hypothetical protein